MTTAATPRPITAPSTSATGLYDAALLAAAAGGAAALTALSADGRRRLPVERWCGAASGADLVALDRLVRALPEEASVLDLGCGPGRHSAHLARQGLQVLGVDTSPVSIALARARGVTALRADVLGPLPDQPHGLDGVLLLDGNIGIGGDPLLLLCRVRDLLAPDGRVLVELDDADVSDDSTARLHDGRRVSAPFAWARLAAADLPCTACRAGLRVKDSWGSAGRRFALLTPVRP